MNLHNNFVPLFIALLTLTVCINQTLAQSQEPSNHGEIQYGWNDVSSSVAPPGGGLFDINVFVGANTYYSNGITGQNTRSTVAEAGLIWNGNESLTHVTNFYSSSFSYGGTNQNLRVDRHATWVAGVLGGRVNPANPQIYQQGIAYGTTLGGAALANNWAGSAYTLSFGWNYNSWTGAIFPTFINSDVINQSYGFSDPAGTNIYTRMMDALANANSKVISIGSAGNTTNAGTVGSPGGGYNSLAVGALSPANSYNSVATFSSRGPQNWGYRTSGGSFVIVTNVRTEVDIVTPGTSIIAPFYGAQTGGNNTSLSGSTNLGTNPAQYSALSGTSFSAPIVSGGASLVMSAAKTLPALQGNLEAQESVVIKALLLNGANKIAGWNNGQVTNAGVVTTTQSLDYNSGAGAMNLSKTYTNQTGGTLGVGFNVQGNQGVVEAIGWDFGASSLFGTNSYMLSGLFSSNSTMTTTLSWLRQVSMDTNLSSTNANDIAEANLNLNVWSMNPDGTIGDLVGSSQSTYNLTEHLHFQLPTTGYYIVGIAYTTNNFDNTGTWGSGTNTQNYGIAWSSASAENIYWQGGNWSSNSSWNTLSDGGGVSATNSSVVVNTLFGDGSPSQPPQSLLIEGTQYTKGITFQSGEVSLDTTNSGTIFVGVNGINLNATTSGDVTVSSNTSIYLMGDQLWANNSSQSLEINGNVTGLGNLQISNGSSSAEVLLANINSSGALANTGLGTTKVNGSISNSVTGVTQSGGGTLELNGNNNYNGVTTVSAGNLSVNGSTTASSLTSVSGSGTLKGAGTVGNTMLTAGGTVNPGNSIGMLSVEGDITWDINGNYNWEIYDATGIAGIGYDTINVSGSLDLSLLGPADFNINLWSLAASGPDQSGNAINFDPNQDYLWTILSTDEDITNFNSSYFDINSSAFNSTEGFSNTLNGSFSITQNNNDLVLAYNTVPEPSTYALLTIVGAFLLLKTIKKRKFN